MEDDARFKEFIKRLSKLPVVYNDTFHNQATSIPILSFPIAATVKSDFTTAPSLIEDQVTVKVLNGQAFKVPRSGKVGELKRHVNYDNSSPVRIIYQGRALGDDFELCQLPRDTTLQAVITNITTAPINREALKRDISAVLLRHGIPPVQIDSLVSSFISQLTQSPQ